MPGESQQRAPGSSIMRPLILCASRFEHSLLAGSPWLAANTRIVCTGPGTAAVASFLRSLRDPYDPIIFAGLAGALNSQCAVGGAWAAGRVTDERGTSWNTTWPRAGGTHRGLAMVTVLGADHVLLDQSAKTAARREFDADLVDIESPALARWATEVNESAIEVGGQGWGVVRGVSDGPGDSLPPGADLWLRSDGTLDQWRFMLDLSRRPWSIAQVWRLYGRSRAAMREVVAVLESLLREQVDQADV